MVRQIAKLIIISGERGQGKTHLCMAIAAQAKQHSLRVQGVFSPAVFKNGVKVGIQVEDASSGERRQLATLRQEPGSGELQTEHWVFDHEGIAWGSEILAHSGACDLLIVDELGPLEFLQQKGWVQGFSAIEKAHYRLGVVVVRPELLEEARNRWKEISIYTVNPMLLLEEQAAQILANLSS